MLVIISVTILHSSSTSNIARVAGTRWILQHQGNWRAMAGLQARFGRALKIRVEGLRGAVGYGQGTVELGLLLEDPWNSRNKKTVGWIGVSPRGTRPW